MTTMAEQEQWRERAIQSVERFVRRFDESYRLLAYHAALPLVLTPELVHYLRNEFLRGEQVPWEAEVDLLLSDLCSQVGYELYAIDTHVRAYLLEAMAQDTRFGKRRMQEVAQVLISYVNYLNRLNPGKRRQEIEAQRWAAMTYLGDEQCKKAAREIAQRFIETSSGMSSEKLTESGMRAELARLTRITEELSPQLQQEQNLLDYAKLVQRILRTPDDVSPTELLSSYKVDDMELTFSDKFLPETLAMAVKSSRQPVPIPEGSSPLQSFEFEVAIIEVSQSAQPSTLSLPELTDETVFNRTGKHLSDVEKFLLKGALANQTYAEMAATGSYTESYLKDIGLKLWKVLSKVLGTKVNKRNLLSILERLRLTIHRHRQQAQHFIEDLGNGVHLEMVAIPGGSFLMGSPEDEIERFTSEGPQHPVTIKPFFLGKYPVTQAQWQAVASLPQVERELDPDPSSFKGANRPVEQVSWYDSIEFCKRLTRHTGKPYRLPSEAEWEYACRAGTTTPFHFGETITDELANYDASYTYGAGVKGVYRKETTPVGSFGVANDFGLYDMHGNVWEWCADHWHGNYQEAPTHGEAWLNENDNDYRLLRGGSWDNLPRYCRSASSVSNSPDGRYGSIGFRVACSSVWT